MTEGVLVLRSAREKVGVPGEVGVPPQGYTWLDPSEGYTHRCPLWPLASVRTDPGKARMGAPGVVSGESEASMMRDHIGYGAPKMPGVVVLDTLRRAWDTDEGSRYE